MKTKKQDEEEYRTVKDVMKEIAKSYNDLGKLIFELERMVKK